MSTLDTPRTWTHRLCDANGGEVLDRYVYLALGVFGSISPTDDDRKALTEHLNIETARWVNERFGLGLKDDHLVDAERERLLDLIAAFRRQPMWSTTSPKAWLIAKRADAVLREYGRLGKGES